MLSICLLYFIMPQYFNNVQQFLQVKGYIPPLENRSQLSAKVKKKIKNL